ncbi:MAG: hypothetical protein QME42_10675 [bacterium]|nr:hypothetical protein [bacterium]
MGPYSQPTSKVNRDILPANLWIAKPLVLRLTDEMTSLLML